MVKRRDFLKGMFFVPVVGIGFDLKKDDFDIFEVMQEVAQVLFPTSEYFPGAKELGVTTYIKEALMSGYVKEFDKKMILQGLYVLEKKYYFLASKNKEAVLEKFLATPSGEFWFDIFMEYLTEGVFCHPIYGGNKNKQGYKAVNFKCGKPEPTTRYANGKRV